MFESKAEEQLRKSFPEVLNRHAVVRNCMGGEFNFEQMNFVEKMLVRKIAGINESISQIEDQSIKAFAAQMIA